MPRSARLPQQIEADLALIARYYLRGYNQRELADMLVRERNYTVAPKTLNNWVWKALIVLHERWVASQLLDFNEAKAKELARIDKLEQAYWEAWDRSVADATETETELVNDTQGEEKPGATYSRVKSRTKVMGRDGNRDYLAGIEKCIEMRCKILGLFSPNKVAAVDWRTAAQEAGVPESTASQEFEALVEKYTAELGHG